MMYPFCHLAFIQVITTKLPQTALLPILLNFPCLGRPGTLFLEGHHTLVLGQDEAAALVCLLCAGLGKKLIPSHKVCKTVENGG